MAHLRTSKLCKAAQRFACHVERIAIGWRSHCGAQGSTDDFEGRMKLLRTSWDVAQHDATSNVEIEDPLPVAKRGGQALSEVGEPGHWNRQTRRSPHPGPPIDWTCEGIRT
ncbi:TPA: hypothetical protein QDB49_001232 [Burkholderia vietnamiensis]|nr:hypothetical protein [Burkholderia vietnamiensis]